MALQERTTPPVTTKASTPQTEPPTVVLLYGSDCKDKRVIELCPPDPAFPGVRFARVVGEPPVFSFQPLKKALQAEGIENPYADPSWPERRRAYMRMPAVIEILLANGLE